MTFGTDTIRSGDVVSWKPVDGVRRMGVVLRFRPDYKMEVLSGGSTFVVSDRDITKEVG